MFHPNHRWRLGATLHLLLFVAFAPFVCIEAEAADPVPIVVTIPVLKDLTEQIGRSHVRVTSLLTGYENEHTYSPKPSDLVAVRRAHLLFQIGIGLEVWVSSLVKNAGSPSLRVVTTSHGIPLIYDHMDHHEQEGAGHDGQESEPGGNPHIWLDPANVAIMLGHITNALIERDPSHAAEFRANHTAYVQQLDRLQRELSDRLKPIVDRRFIAHHPAWPYLAKRFGFNVVGTIQVQSGSEPSALHLQSLISSIKQHHIKLIVSEIQLSQRLPELLSGETKARVVILTTLPGGLPGTETYLDMLRYNVLQLANALGAT